MPRRRSPPSWPYRGEWDPAAHHLAAAETLAASHDSIEAVITARVAAGALGRAQHRPQAVIDALGDLPSVAPMMAALTFWPTLVVALIDSGQLDRAADLVHWPQRRGCGQDPRLRGPSRRPAGPAGRGPRPARRGNRSLRHGPWPVRSRRPVPGPGADPPRLRPAAAGQRRTPAGRHRLRDAHQLLSSVGADPFVARVDADLAATGIHPPTNPVAPPWSLTDRERDVAVLVAQGLTNPEVAEQLYISRKAVEYHLRNTYGKLGISVSARAALHPAVNRSAPSK